MRREEFYINAAPGPLPSGYSQLNYIECTGTQYIKTNVYITPNLKWFLNVEWIQFNPTNAFGAEDWLYSTSIIRIATDDRYDSKGNYVGLNLNYGDTNNYGLYAGRNYQEMLGVHTFYVENGHQYMDDVEIAQGNVTKSNSYMIYFFCSNSSNSPMYYCKKARLYYSWMKNGDTLIREFIPALRIVDSKPGLYDTVNDVFYTNAGSGEFNYA